MSISFREVWMSGGPFAAKALSVLFFALLLSSSACCQAFAGSVPRTVADDPSIPRVELGGAVFHVETFGDPASPPVIVVHGGPGWDFRALLPLKALSDEYFVVFYDQRGTGLSPRVDPSELSLESSISDLDAIVDHNSKGSRVRLIGHSWGAMLSSAYIGRHPEKVGGAVLAEPGFLTTEMMNKAGIKYGVRWEAGFLWRVAKALAGALFVSGGKDDAVDYVIGQVAPYASPEFYCGGATPEAARTFWRPSYAAMRAIMKSAENEEGEMEVDFVKGVDKFDGTVLFMAGECNGIIGAAHQREQMKYFPRAELVVIGRSGHMIFAERPDESVGAVREYFGR